MSSSVSKAKTASATAQVLSAQLLDQAALNKDVAFTHAKRDELARPPRCTPVCTGTDLRWRAPRGRRDWRDLGKFFLSWSGSGLTLSDGHSV